MVFVVIPDNTSYMTHGKEDALGQIADLTYISMLCSCLYRILD